jgi:hypothetical protein
VSAWAFMFQLSSQETDDLVSQNVIPSKKVLGGYLPYAFAEQGVAMLSSVLRGRRAVQVNIAIMRAFVRLRQVLATHKELADRLSKLEQRMDGKDKEVMALFEAIRQLVEPQTDPRKRPIGFSTERE